METHQRISISRGVDLEKRTMVLNGITQTDDVLFFGNGRIHARESNMICTFKGWEEHAQKLRAFCDGQALASASNYTVLHSQTERYTWSKLIHTPFPRWLVANLWRNGVREFVACFDNITEVERYIEHLHACHTSPVLEMEQVHPLLARKAAARSCSIWDAPYTGEFDVTYTLGGLVSHVSVAFEVELMEVIEELFIHPVLKTPIITMPSGETQPMNVISVIDRCRTCQKKNITMLYGRKSPALTSYRSNPGKFGDTFCACTMCASCGNMGASKKCSKCLGVRYCSRECQVADWAAHKKTCNTHS